MDIVFGFAESLASGKLVNEKLTNGVGSLLALGGKAARKDYAELTVKTLGPIDECVFRLRQNASTTSLTELLSLIDTHFGSGADEIVGRWEARGGGRMGC